MLLLMLFHAAALFQPRFSRRHAYFRCYAYFDMLLTAAADMLC